MLWFSSITLFWKCTDWAKAAVFVCPCLGRLIGFWWCLLTCSLLIDTEGKCYHLWGRSVVLFTSTSYFLGYWHLLLHISWDYNEDKRIIPSLWPFLSPHIPSLDSEVYKKNFKTRLVMLVAIDCLSLLPHGGCSTGHSLSLSLCRSFFSATLI